MSEYSSNQADVAGQGLTPDNYVFALDIGTRSVIGIVGWQGEDLFHVVDTELCEHPKRAMIDGQIEDIQQVARIAGQVKQALERRAGFELRHVNVAAAGRALKTARASFELNVNTGEGVTTQQINELETGAIMRAREQVDAEADSALNFYCAGHSAVRYMLDDYPYATILGHKGAVARADIIATFLPTEVVDSLCAAMAIIGCEIGHLTLEPIAAMNAVIPSELRLLNLALVDIGAGTSDIAISEGGSVAAYTMATVAGDEITEELIHRFLVDFQTAERMKHAAANNEERVSYRDILGFDYELGLSELLDVLGPAVQSLSDEICKRILDSNGKAPAAVFLVGGGSLAPLLCERVAGGLQIDQRKVAVGGNNFIQRVASTDDCISGPAYATPLGIALTAVAAGTQQGFYVTINGKRTRLFRSEAMAALDVLLLCGYQYHELMGRNGKSITYRLDGKKYMLRGGYFQPARILVNGVEANISTAINCEDEILVEKAVNGEDACLSLREIGLFPRSFSVLFNGSEMEAGFVVRINGKSVSGDQQIKDLDVLETQQLQTLRDLCKHLGMAEDARNFLINNAACQEDDQLMAGDSVICVTMRTAFVPVRVEEAVPQIAERPRPRLMSQPDVTAQQQAPVVPPVREPVAMPQKIPVMPPMQEPVATAQPMPVMQPVRESDVTAQQMPVMQPVRAPDVTAQQMPVMPPVWAPDATAQQMPAMPPMREPDVIAQPMPAMPPVREPDVIAQQTPVMPPVREPDVIAQQTPVMPPVQELAMAATAPVHVVDEVPPASHRPQIRVTLNEQSMLLDPKESGAPYEFIDMLNFVDLDPTKPQGNIILMLNGCSASYLDPVRNGDVIEIRWENE